MYWIWVLVNSEELDITRRPARESIKNKWREVVLWPGSNLSSRKKRSSIADMEQFLFSLLLSVLNILQRYSKDATTHRGLNFDMIV